LPLYDYECLSCGHIFELRQSFNDEPTGTCPVCDGDARRKFHAVPVIYKGSGFYTTDYARSSVKANGTSTKSEENEEVKKAPAKAKDPTSSSGTEKKESDKADSTTTKSKE
tara:strand:+ start:271 stop:603 length:333 start_codon:yes stop_codon:yes gene_type:complete